MDTPITRAEHEEFRRRMEEVHSRQNKRLENLERDMEDMKKINTSIETLAVNMKNMLDEQVRQGERLEVLESRDGEMWRKVTGYIITAVIGIVLGFLFTHIGIK